MGDDKMIKCHFPWKALTHTPKTIKDIVGKTPTNITVSGVCEDEIEMVFDDGTACKFYHEQDCCEDVSIEDVNGNWGDLIGTPLLVAEEREGESGEKDYETFTWTFYTFRSIKGSVDVRWYGTSNGYYSEGVNFIGGEVTHDPNFMPNSSHILRG